MPCYFLINTHWVFFRDMCIIFCEFVHSVMQSILFISISNYLINGVHICIVLYCIALHCMVLYGMAWHSIVWYGMVHACLPVFLSVVGIYMRFPVSVRKVINVLQTMRNSRSDVAEPSFRVDIFFILKPLSGLQLMANTLMSVFLHLDLMMLAFVPANARS